MRPIISVVVTVYNFERWIEVCLQSILNQEGNFDLEIIVIEDASQDQSLAVLTKIKDPRVRVIRHTENKGANFSVNEGFSLAKGDFIARIDGDDFYQPGFFARALIALDQNTEAGFVYGDFMTIDSDGKVTNPHARPARPEGPLVRNEFRFILENYYINAPTLLGRRIAWKKALPVPSAFSFLDWFMSLSMSLEFPAVYIPEVLASYRVHNTSMHSTMIKDRKGEYITLLILERFIPAGVEKGLLTKHDISLIKAVNFRTLATKYFGAGMMSESALFYRKAVLARPLFLFSSSFMKYFSGSHFPGVYSFLKWAARRFS